MSLMNLQLEGIKLPKNYEAIILEDHSLTPELKKQGFNKGSAPIYWQSVQDGICLEIMQDDDDGTVKLMYRITFFSSADGFDEYEHTINKWAKENNINGEKNHKWASWICEAFDNDEDYANDDDAPTVSAPKGWKSVYISTGSLKLFNRMRTVLSSAIRELASVKFKIIEQAFADATTDINKIEECAEYLNEKPEELAAYPKLWPCMEAIIQAHGVNENTVPLLAAVCGLPSRGLKKEIEKLCTTYNIKEILAADSELADSLFYALQTSVGGYYITQTSGYATKAVVKKVAKMFAVACNALGFGIYPNSLVAVIRLFENDAAEGIGLDWYKSDEKYDAEEFGYYDGEVNEEYYNEFWEKIDILSLIK